MKTIGHSNTGGVIVEIREKYATGLYTVRMLASEYSVHHSTIWKILNRKTWRHI